MLSFLESAFPVGIEGLVSINDIEAAVSLSPVFPDNGLSSLRLPEEFVKEFRNSLTGLLDPVGIAPADEVEPAAVFVPELV